LVLVVQVLALVVLAAIQHLAHLLLLKVDEVVWQEIT
jgi:hypothetical protein